MIVLTDKNFKEEVLESKVPVLVDFWASWCGPCKMIAPELEKLEAEYGDKIKIGKINIDDYTPVALEYDVQVIPTLLYFVEGQVKTTIRGFYNKGEIAEKIFK